MLQGSKWGADSRTRLRVVRTFSELAGDTFGVRSDTGPAARLSAATATCAWRKAMSKQVREQFRLLTTVGTAIVLAAGLVACNGDSSDEGPAPFTVPKATCGPNDKPET